jgi:hypothetical protein
MPVIPDSQFPDHWPSNLLGLIGEIVIAAGQLEHAVNLSYKRLAKQDYSPGMQQVADMLRFTKKTRAIKQAANARGLVQSDRMRLSEIMRGANSAWKDRNGVIHAVYAELPSGKRVRRHQVSKSGQPFESKDLGLREQDFESIVTALRNSRDELDQFKSPWKEILCASLANLRFGG